MLTLMSAESRRESGCESGVAGCKRRRERGWCVE